MVSTYLNLQQSAIQSDSIPQLVYVRFSIVLQIAVIHCRLFNIFMEIYHRVTNYSMNICPLLPSDFTFILSLSYRHSLGANELLTVVAVTKFNSM